MELLFTKAFVALGIVFILLFLACIMMFIKHEICYRQIVERYLDAGLFMPGYLQFLTRTGFFGSFPVVFFFRQIMAEKNVKTAPGEYLPEACYAFFRSQPAEALGWMRVYSAGYGGLIAVFLALVGMSFVA
ncbi:MULTISPECIES: hypothetical protein [Serratia]|uniref:Uncharacterized protein n=1 Tax=Serratia ficaria TaxID=61651 RepID=A0A240BQW8_SERFI|nr:MULTISPECIES: hypothetical protein [Serratia]REF45520.1 hypothetical protein C7332_3860 [Serratia ficaria]CAI0859566.1 Uncharacterised protein [Serratia ficaria]CAI0877519.1 Uncharacterised protein [Serratia ficaria]CAI0903720.1 Uncharacterised protein [Serratia ficaria]CAI0955676.1 Uncharacterised protein [Serratia ficaria]